MARAKQKLPTMKDVAKAASVSIQTVSAVINHKPGISQETTARVQAVIEELGYRPFSVARSLRTHSTRTIALIVSDITNPFFSKMASIAEDYAHASGYNLILFNTHSDFDRENEYLIRAKDRWIDGILFISTSDTVKGLDVLKNAGIPIVFIDRIPDDFDGPWISLDNMKTGYLVGEYLANLGHTHMAHINGPLDLRLSRERLEGFKTALKEHGLPDPVCASSDDRWSSESGYCAMIEILKSNPRPTAVFAANDRLAIGSMRAIAEAGLCIPEDISLVGVDDIEAAAYVNPPLTTIRQPLEDVATLGIKNLLDILKCQEPEVSHVILEPNLKVRGSTAKPFLVTK